jgi:hypothetical protein
MSMKTRTTMIYPTMVALSWLVLGGGARADLTLDTPAGLNPGDQFRFVFVTDGVGDATSGNIGDYNTFVTTDASNEAGGGTNVATYMGVTLTWSAIASTIPVAAKDNIFQTPTSLYLSDGSLVATSTETSDPTGLWSSLTSPLSHPINEDLTQSLRSTTVWTGTTPLGTSNAPLALGQQTASFGASFQTDNTWVFISSSDSRESRPFYGISQVLTVPGTAVPEPSTAIVAVFGAVAFIAYGLARKRQAHRRQAAA